MKNRLYLAAGWGTRCDWYQNLLADPHVTLQVWSEGVTGVRGEVVIPALARRVTEEGEFREISARLFETGGDSHFKPWLRSLGIDYSQEDLVAKRERVHQVALDLQPSMAWRDLVQSDHPAPMETDLKWVWIVIAGAFSLGYLAGRKRR